MAQITIGNEDTRLQVGILGQFWGDWNQSPGTQGYAQNLYLRRARILMSLDIGENIFLFLQTDAPNLGKTPKAMNSGFLLQDAFMEYRVNHAFHLDGGLMIVPFCRNALQSPASYYTIDLSQLSTVTGSATQSSAFRDAGFAVSGFFFNDHLLYRTGVFEGERDTNAKNSLRSAGFVQYDFFDAEKGYTFLGTALGKKKILAVSGGFDRQGTYRAYSGNVSGDLPVHQGDEIGGQFQFTKYDGRTKFPAILNQNDYLLEGAYYVHRLHVQPIGKFESQNYVATTASTTDINRYGTGVNCYLHGQNLKWTMQYVRAIPRNSAIHPGNEFTAQLQLFYF